jgi:hypothetical protein
MAVVACSAAERFLASARVAACCRAACFVNGSLSSSPGCEKREDHYMTCMAYDSDGILMVWTSTGQRSSASGWIALKPMPELVTHMPA